MTGGWLTDRLARRHSLRVARCGLGFTAFATTAALLFASTLTPAPTAKALLLALALGSADLSLSACWAAPLDVAAAHAGVITGFMNTFGNLGGLLCPLVVGWAVERQHSWTLPFYITAVGVRRGRHRLAGHRPGTSYLRRRSRDRCALIPERGSPAGKASTSERTGMYLSEESTPTGGDALPRRVCVTYHGLR